jgi:eukaryotic-like serine/threonine-protein kinase
MHASDPHSSSVSDPAQAAGGEPPWELIADRIDAFAAAWDKSQADDAPPPTLDRFVADLDELTARQVLPELVKLDLERRWQHGREPHQVEWYAEQYPQLRPVAKLPVDLLYEELQARMHNGRPVYQEEVRERFPQQAESLLRLLGGLAISGSPTATYYGDTIATKKGGGTPVASPAPRSAAFSNLQPGQTLDDFQLITPLGSGAFARVFLARQVSMERMVALKISAAAGSEPQTLAQLDHPNIVRVFDQRQTTEPPARLLYMEVVPGGTLQDVIARMRHTYDGRATGDMLLATIDERLSAAGQPIPETSSNRSWIAEASWPDIVCRLGAELAEGLAYAHSRGVMHRDIKPANVLLSAEGRPKLADFNVSYNGGRADENPEDTFGGSLAYMSPEQLEACHPLLGGSPRLVREPSDIYALGVMLWELLCGRRPFRDEHVPHDGGSLVRLQRMIEVRRRADFKQLAAALPADCPESLRRVLIMALEPDKANRYQTASELASALRLSLNPRCWQLLQPPKSRLGRFILKWPVLSGVLAGLVPNALIARFNLIYNRTRILDKDGWPSLLPQFEDTQIVVNCIAFTIGILGGAWMTLRAVRFVKGKFTTRMPDGSGIILDFAWHVSVLVLTLWTVCGMVFPIAVAWDHHGDEKVGVDFYIHFFMSLALCGFAATAYPYFLTTSGIVRTFLPQMIRNGAIAGPRRDDLERVRALNAVHMLMAGCVPSLGVLMMVLFNMKEDFALGIVSGGGVIGLIIAAWLWRRIARDAQALAHVATDERRVSGRSRLSRLSRSSSRSSSHR